VHGISRLLDFSFTDFFCVALSNFFTSDLNETLQKETLDLPQKGLGVIWSHTKVTWGNFPTSTLALSNFFTSDLNETL
jgi:hypothetical protein